MNYEYLTKYQNKPDILLKHHGERFFSSNALLHFKRLEAVANKKPIYYCAALIFGILGTYKTKNYTYFNDLPIELIRYILEYIAGEKDRWTVEQIYKPDASQDITQQWRAHQIREAYGFLSQIKNEAPTSPSICPNACVIS